jgi:hypothetical protein
VNLFIVFNIEFGNKKKFNVNVKRRGYHVAISCGWILTQLRGVFEIMKGRVGRE